MDEKGAMKVSEITESIGLNSIRKRNWHICATSGTTGQGLNDGFQWLLENIRISKQSKSN